MSDQNPNRQQKSKNFKPLVASRQDSGIFNKNSFLPVPGSQNVVRKAQPGSQSRSAPAAGGRALAPGSQSAPYGTGQAGDWGFQSQQGGGRQGVSGFWPRSLSGTEQRPAPPPSFLPTPFRQRARARATTPRLDFYSLHRHLLMSIKSVHQIGANSTKPLKSKNFPPSEIQNRLYKSWCTDILYLFCAILSSSPADFQQKKAALLVSWGGCTL